MDNHLIKTPLLNNPVLEKRQNNAIFAMEKRQKKRQDNIVFTLKKDTKNDIRIKNN